MTTKRKYEVIAVDTACNPDETRIEWLSISTSSNKLCPYVVLDDPVYNRLSSFHLIRKDLNFAWSTLEKLKDL